MSTYSLLSLTASLKVTKLLQSIMIADILFYMSFITEIKPKRLNIIFISLNFSYWRYPYTVLGTLIILIARYDVSIIRIRILLFVPERKCNETIKTCAINFLLFVFKSIRSYTFYWFIFCFISYLLFANKVIIRFV